MITLKDWSILLLIGLIVAIVGCAKEENTTVFVYEDTPIQCKSKRSKEPKKDKDPKKDEEPEEVVVVDPVKEPTVVFIIEVENESPTLVTCEDI